MNDCLEVSFRGFVGDGFRLVIYHFFHQFEPFGVSGIILISWSHFAVHTWPEDCYAAFDVFTCGEMVPELAIESLKEDFQAQRVDVQIIPRGF